MNSRHRWLFICIIYALLFLVAFLMLGLAAGCSTTTLSLWRIR